MRRSILSLGLALCLSGLAAPAQAEGPSFDCAKAQTPVEKLICGDDTLGDLDGQMGEAYRQARTAASPERKAALLREQRAWARERDARCGVTVQSLGEIGTRSGVVQCLTEQTYWRVQALRTTADAAPAPAPQADAAEPTGAEPAGDVFQIQFGLRVLGLYDGPVNGLPGKSTREAAGAFAAQAQVDPADPAAVLEALRPRVAEAAGPPAPSFRDPVKACPALVNLARRLDAADLCQRVEGVGLPPDYDCAQFPAMLAAGRGKPDAQAKAIWDETIASLDRLARYPWVRGTGACS
ncbi:lysozyme inhibitor LprI family protein [Zavarzinia sp. CC-PAN008]|uniref:lysozyme inhibitor LprI family protein n=1 Tax=Zavarzinia sp. CC-PAN008 TaxID=3243332 RepID=UPI003F747381